MTSSNLHIVFLAALLTLPTGKTTFGLIRSKTLPNCRMTVCQTTVVLYTEHVRCRDWEFFKGTPM